jgi:hypothetical protein
MNKSKINVSKEHFDKWLTGLRDGSYKQGRGALCQKVGTPESNVKQYCCLGVLGDVMGRLAEDPDGEFAQSHYVLEGETYIQSGRSGFLPREVIEQRLQSELADRNDQGYDFTVIADYIEKNMEPIDG